MSKEKFKIETEIAVTQENIDDILCTAFEGGINYWCDKIRVKNEDYKGVTFASDVISRGGELILLFEGEKKTLNLENFKNGLKKWFDDGCGKDCFYDGEIDCGNIDAGCADQIVQLALFNEIIYG